MRILLTTTSYQDTPGKHHDILSASGFEVVRARGPLTEHQLLDLITTDREGGAGFDGLLNGDDAVTASIIDTALAQPRPLRVIAKYGIGLDSIDVDHATAQKIPVLFTPGVNHTTVAEHAFGLMIAASKSFLSHMNAVKAGTWKRQTGRDLAGKTLGVVGLGRISKELVKRAVAFDMNVIGYGNHWDDEFAKQFGLARRHMIEDLFKDADVISLHTKLTDTTRRLINAESIDLMKRDVIIVNTARGGLVDEGDIAQACRSGRVMCYAADVLAHEPIDAPHEFQEVDNILITPHIGSRTHESVQRQGVRATLNLVNYLNGDEDFIQANEF